MKRPYPFSLENPPCPPSFNFKFPTFVGPVRVDEPASCGINGSSFTLEARNAKLRLDYCHLLAVFIVNDKHLFTRISFCAIYREGPSCSTSISESLSRNRIKENGASNGDFLTLALPTWTCTQRPKFNHPPAYLSFHNREIPNFETLPYKVRRKQQLFHKFYVKFHVTNFQSSLILCFWFLFLFVEGKCK